MDKKVVVHPIGYLGLPQNISCVYALKYYSLQINALKFTCFSKNLINKTTLPILSVDVFMDVLYAHVFPGLCVREKYSWE